MNLNDFVAAARASNAIFAVVFRKKSGELRRMQCRMHVRKGVQGVLAAGQRRAEDARCRVLTVFDMAQMRKHRAAGRSDDDAAKASFRRINLDGLMAVTMGGQHWTVDGDGNLTRQGGEA